MKERTHRKLGSERLAEALLLELERQRDADQDEPIPLAIIGSSIGICMAIEDVARQLVQIRHEISLAKGDGIKFPTRKP